MKNILLASVGIFVLGVASCGGTTSSSGTAGTTGSGTAGTTGSGTAGTTGSGTAGTDGSGSAGTTGSGTAGTTATGDAGTTGAAGTSPAGTAGTSAAGTSGGTAGNGAGGTAAGGRGGTGTAGTSAGGTTGTAGRGGTTGAGGGGTTGTGGAAANPTFPSTSFGSLDGAFMITPCMSAGTGYDCPNLPMGMTSCPTANWSYGSVSTTEPTGNTYTEVFTVTGGDPTKIYDVTLRVLGQAEGRTYTGGTRALTANVDPNAATNNLLYTGGRPGTTRVDYNVFQLTIDPPSGGTAISGAATYFAFNAVDSSHEGAHYNYGVDETFTIKVKTGFTVTLTSHDSNCIAIKNCGPGGPYNFASASACEAVARSTPSTVTLPATFRGQAITSPTKFQTQFLNFKVMSIVAE